MNRLLSIIIDIREYDSENHPNAPQYDINSLIDSKEQLLIPLGTNYGNMYFIDEEKRINIDIDRFDAFSLIRGSEHIMLCFLLKWINKRFPKHQSISVKLSTHENRNHKAYENMGFTEIKPSENEKL